MHWCCLCLLLVLLQLLLLLVHLHLHVSGWPFRVRRTIPTRGASLYLPGMQLGGYAFIGEGIPVGLGAAFQIAYNQRVLGNEQDDRVSVNFFGDGTCNVGACCGRAPFGWMDRAGLRAWMPRADFSAEPTAVHLEMVNCHHLPGAHAAQMPAALLHGTAAAAPLLTCCSALAWFLLACRPVLRVAQHGHPVQAALHLCGGEQQVGHRHEPPPRHGCVQGRAGQGRAGRAGQQD